ncbi:hypothetical protein SC1083_1369 [Aggregatibacter actinomycetemcomitans serotype e str. SC1083]|uniref:Uncharacterized protein n=1 Tax=Aggregatibacter actinomycetemcomitans serotype e str. SC1083 TaxID=907488 RepID=G4A961_AGGAC|nr:hypothetical protein SC1083_1369 [Aggregatibacter actinomycetemcomitans serotype e str. SC1083]
MGIEQIFYLADLMIFKLLRIREENVIVSVVEKSAVLFSGGFYASAW